MKLVILEEAELELQLATEWFEEQRAGLGTEFSDAVLKLLHSIAANPMQFGPVPGSRHKEQIRVGLVRRFRYTVIFKVHAKQQELIVVSIHHGHRRPGKLRGRLDSIESSED